MSYSFEDTGTDWFYFKTDEIYVCLCNQMLLSFIDVFKIVSTVYGGVSGDFNVHYYIVTYIWIRSAQIVVSSFVYLALHLEISVL